MKLDRMLLKIIFMKFRYYTKRYFFRFWENWLAIFLFFCSFCAFFVIAFPSAIRHAMLTVAKFETPPTSYHIYGTVEDISDAKMRKPVAHARIEIGGAATVTDENGEYNLKFTASVTQSLPMVVTQSTTSCIRRVNLAKTDINYNVDLPK